MLYDNIKSIVAIATLVSLVALIPLSDKYIDKSKNLNIDLKGLDIGLSRTTSKINDAYTSGYIRGYTNMSSSIINSNYIHPKNISDTTLENFNSVKENTLKEIAISNNIELKDKFEKSLTKELLNILNPFTWFDNYTSMAICIGTGLIISTLICSYIFDNIVNPKKDIIHKLHENKKKLINDISMSKIKMTEVKALKVSRERAIDSIHSLKMQEGEKRRLLLEAIEEKKNHDLKVLEKKTVDMHVKNLNLVINKLNENIQCIENQKFSMNTPLNSRLMDVIKRHALVDNIRTNQIVTVCNRETALKKKLRFSEIKGKDDIDEPNIQDKGVSISFT